MRFFNAKIQCTLLVCWHDSKTQLFPFGKNFNIQKHQWHLVVLSFSLKKLFLPFSAILTWKSIDDTYIVAQIFSLFITGKSVTFTFHSFVCPSKNQLFFLSSFQTTKYLTIWLVCCLFSSKYVTSAVCCSFCWWFLRFKTLYLPSFLTEQKNSLITFP